jgi:hypothetical protein
MLNVQLNDKVVGRTELDNTGRMISLLCVASKVKSYSL